MNFLKPFIPWRNFSRTYLYPWFMIQANRDLFTHWLWNPWATIDYQTKKDYMRMLTMGGEMQ